MRAGRCAVLVAAGAIAAAASVLGCAGSRQKGAAGDEVVCTHEPVTGSHIVEARCFTRSQIEERRAQDRAAVERMIIQANRPGRSQPAQGGPRALP